MLPGTTSTALRYNTVSISNSSKLTVVKCNSFVRQAAPLDLHDRFRLGGTSTSTEVGNENGYVQSTIPGTEYSEYSITFLFGHTTYGSTTTVL